jgi:hypothetical protein
MGANREILMKFITQQNEKVKQDVSMQGYKDNSPYRNNPSNTIYGTPQGTSITMQDVSTPLVGMDEFGNKQQMFPGQEYQFPGARVVETPMARYGGLLNKTVKCNNCGWSWKAADGGNDVGTCHKCGEQVDDLLKAQYGKQTDYWNTDKKAFVDSTLTANKNLDFVKRLYDQSKGSIQIPGVPGRSTHYMADDNNRVYPTVVNKDNKLQYLSNPDQAWEYANDNKEYIDFQTPEQAAWFANSPDHSTGYKMGTNVLTTIPHKQNGGDYTGNWFKNADVMSVSNKYQTAGTVKYGTPEYEEAYNKGEVVTKDGQRSPILLDEVTVQNNYKRPRGFWEQYRDKIVEENKDAGVLGAIVGTVPISLNVATLSLDAGFSPL